MESGLLEIIIRLLVLGRIVLAVGAVVSLLRALAEWSWERLKAALPLAWQLYRQAIATAFLTACILSSVLVAFLAREGGEGDLKTCPTYHVQLNATVGFWDNVRPLLAVYPEIDSAAEPFLSRYDIFWRSKQRLGNGMQELGTDLVPAWIAAIKSDVGNQAALAKEIEEALTALEHDGQLCESSAPGLEKEGIKLRDTLHMAKEEAVREQKAYGKVRPKVQEHKESLTNAVGRLQEADDLVIAMRWSTRAGAHGCHRGRIAHMRQEWREAYQSVGNHDRMEEGRALERLDVQRRQWNC
ncbi:hypothetical protein KC349_g8687 [Hortaea werneckii]|nr:hypothetical protein KC349_g8687 [Hortaea werneckii]